MSKHWTDIFIYARKLREMRKKKRRVIVPVEIYRFAATVKRMLCAHLVGIGVPKRKAMRMIGLDWSTGAVWSGERQARSISRNGASWVWALLPPEELRCLRKSIEATALLAERLGHGEKK